MAAEFLKYVREHPFCTIRELSEALNITKPSANRNLHRLMAANRIKVTKNTHRRMLEAPTESPPLPA